MRKLYYFGLGVLSTVLVAGGIIHAGGVSYTVTATAQEGIDVSRWRKLSPGYVDDAALVQDLCHSAIVSGIAGLATGDKASAADAFATAADADKSAACAALKKTYTDGRCK